MCTDEIAVNETLQTHSLSTHRENDEYVAPVYAHNWKGVSFSGLILHFLLLWNIKTQTSTVKLLEFLACQSGSTMASTPVHFENRYYIYCLYISSLFLSLFTTVTINHFFKTSIKICGRCGTLDTVTHKTRLTKVDKMWEPTRKKKQNLTIRTYEQTNRLENKAIVPKVWNRERKRTNGKKKCNYV